LSSFGPFAKKDKRLMGALLVQQRRVLKIANQLSLSKRRREGKKSKKGDMNGREQRAESREQREVRRKRETS
jgi:hypothetical protein